MDKLLIPASATLFLILDVWVYVSRRTDIWILLGVTAILTRYLSYHRWYDDILILIPIITLLRFANNENFGSSIRSFSVILLSLTILFTLASGGYNLFSEPYRSIYITMQNVVYLSTLIFFIIIARKESSSINPKQSSGANIDSS